MSTALSSGWYSVLRLIRASTSSARLPQPVTMALPASSRPQISASGDFSKPTRRLTAPPQDRPGADGTPSHQLLLADQRHQQGQVRQSQHR